MIQRHVVPFLMWENTVPVVLYDFHTCNSFPFTLGKRHMHQTGKAKVMITMVGV